MKFVVLLRMIKIRPDGRGLDEIRPLASEVGILPRTHGSGSIYTWTNAST